MAVGGLNTTPFSLPSISLLPKAFPAPTPNIPGPRKLAPFSCSSSLTPPPLMDSHGSAGGGGGAASRFMEFPFVSAPHRNLMVDLMSTVESRLDSFLHPCDVPPDGQYFQNPTATSHGSLYVRSGIQSSTIDFILGSWVHGELPSGGALNITSLSAYLNSSTDAPNFLFELIQSSPTSLILILDVSPRKDLVLHPDYLKSFYEDTGLDSHRQLLEKLPEVRPYVSSSLYIRSVVSPTAILACINTEAGETDRFEEIVRDHVSPIAKKVLGIWLDQCACGERQVGETERAYLEKRDLMIKRKTIEIDLASSFPRLFGQEVAAPILEFLRQRFGACVRTLT